MTSYFGQAQGLPVYNSYEVSVLTDADSAIKAREWGKIATIVGLVSLAGSPVFGYDPAAPLLITMVGLGSWIGGYKVSRYLEPKAQEMLKMLRQRQAEDAVQGPRTKLNFSTQQELEQSKRKLFLSIVESESTNTTG